MSREAVGPLQDHWCVPLYSSCGCYAGCKTAAIQTRSRGAGVPGRAGQPRPQPGAQQPGLQVHEHQRGAAEGGLPAGHVAPRTRGTWEGHAGRQLRVCSLRHASGPRHFHAPAVLSVHTSAAGQPRPQAFYPTYNVARGPLGSLGPHQMAARYGGWRFPENQLRESVTSRKWPVLQLEA